MLYAYLKLKSKKEELYEINIESLKENNFKSNIKKNFINIFLLIVVNIKRILNIITIKEIYNGFIFILPFSKDEYNGKIGEYILNRKIKICMKKFKKMIKKYNVTNLLISEELKKNKNFTQILLNNINRIHILNGREIIKYLIKEIIEYISKKTNQNIQFQDIYILVNKENLEYEKIIKYLTKYFKTTNIVTPSVINYQKIADKIEENNDAILTVTNNKKKSLKKAKWIINFDVPKEQMKKYAIYRSAIIIYMDKKEKETYKDKGFNGINICGVEIDIAKELRNYLKNKYLLNQYELSSLYISFFRNNDFSNIKVQMKKDDVKIINLYGDNGKIEESEYKINMINNIM